MTFRKEWNLQQGELIIYLINQLSAPLISHFTSHWQVYSPGEPRFFTRSIAAFKAGFNSITEIIIGLISIWPFLFLLFAVWMQFKRFHGSVPSMGRKS